MVREQLANEGERTGKENIIGIEPTHDVARRSIETLLDSVGLTVIFFNLKIGKILVIFFYDLRAIISGATVDYYIFKIGVMLVDDGENGPFQEFTLVVRWSNYGNFGRHNWYYKGMWQRLSKLNLGETVDWIKSRDGGVVLCCTLNEMMMASDDNEVRGAMNRANILTPDGMPLVWWLRYKTGSCSRVYGPELLEELIINNEKLIIKHLFIGDKNNKDFFEKYGEYVVLPYREKFEEEDYKMVADKISSGQAKIVWIGLGARKQIIMADELRKRVPNRIYITVGAAFDFLSGNIRQCPKLIRNIGGEWIFRLVTEPKRLSRRYLCIVRYLINRLNPFRVER
jgi:N-acetylglucosaminyldiphosphoundecaprenol N-acetyl-beta-D-mannosaminyltransferase